MENLQFPKGFFFGSATSSHQVEGGNMNDWTEWEVKEAKSKATNSKFQNWPDYILNPPAGGPNPLQEENYVSGDACDHYNRFREDFDIAKNLGHNAHRFSIEWSRIEPEEGKFDHKAIEHYREVIRMLRERGMEPFVTLWHWPLPLWVANNGGWENQKNIQFFTRYCEKIALEFKNDVTYFITLNEPLLWASNAYRSGNFPPQKRNIITAWKMAKNLKNAHKDVYRKLKAINPNFQIGISQNIGWFDFALLRPVYYAINFYFLNSVRNYNDYIGIDYYRRIPFFRRSKPNSDIGWETYPEGIYGVLKEIWKRFEKPIFVLENGIADARDLHRARFIREHLYWVSEAIKSGVDVRGYFYWSLLDNFEWEHGFWPRFGLVEVDYNTQERRIRESAKIYSEIIKTSKQFN